jgi:hypothetical protein
LKFWQSTTLYLVQETQVGEDRRGGRGGEVIVVFLSGIKDAKSVREKLLRK